MQNSVTPATFLVAAGVVLGGQAMRGELKWNGYGDLIAEILFVLLMFWLLSDGRKGVADGAIHESACEKIALRLGKFLNRVRRRLKRGGVTA